MKGNKIVPILVMIILAFAVSVSAADLTPEGNTIDCTTGYQFCDDFEDGSVNYAIWNTTNEIFYTEANGTLFFDDIGAIGPELRWTDVTLDNTTTWCYEHKAQSRDGDFYSQATSTGGYGGSFKIRLADYEGTGAGIVENSQKTTTVDGNNITVRICRYGTLEYNATTWINGVQTDNWYNSTSNSLDYELIPFYFGWDFYLGDSEMYYVRYWSGTESDDPELEPPVSFSNSSYEPTNPIEGQDVNFSIIATDTNGIDRYKFSYYNQSAAAWYNVTTGGPSTLNNGLLYAWEFNESSGDVIDYVNGFNLTVNDATRNQNGYDNTSNEAYYLDNANPFGLGNDYVSASTNYPTNFPNGNDPWTVSTTIKLRDTTPSQQIFWMFGNTAAAGNGTDRNMARLTSISNKLRIQTFNDDGAEVATTLVQDTWYNVIVTYDGATNITIYLDGVYGNHHTLSSNLDIKLDEEVFGIGRATEYTYGFSDAEYDNTIMWDRVLTQAEITEIYNTNRRYEFADSIVDYFTPTLLTQTSEGIVLQDGSNSSDIALNGQTVSAGNNVDTKGWTKYGYKAATYSSYETTQPYLGSYSIRLGSPSSDGGFTTGNLSITDFYGVIGASFYLPSGSTQSVGFDIFMDRDTPWDGAWDDNLRVMAGPTGTARTCDSYIEGSGFQSESGGYTIPTDEWFNVTIDYGGDDALVYFNGDLVCDFGNSSVSTNWRDINFIRFNKGGGASQYLYVDNFYIINSSTVNSGYLLNMTRTMPIEETVYNWTWYARDTSTTTYYQSALYSLNITPASNISVSSYVTPYNPGTNAYLTCNYGFNHTFSETMDINLTWFKNGTHQPSYDFVFSSGNLTGQTNIGQGTVTEDLTESDSWTCSVYVQKGSDDNTATDTVQVGAYVTPEMTFGDFVNNSINATNIMIDLTCANNYYLWFDNVNPPVTLVLNDTATNFYNTSQFSTVNGTYYFYGACVNATTGAPEYKTEVQYWTLDNFFPRTTINPNNAWNENSYATDNQYDDELIINLTINENRDLFAFLINITQAGTEYFSYVNQSLSGTTFNYTNVLDVSAYPRDLTYDINVQASDSHTDDKICREYEKIEYDKKTGLPKKVKIKEDCYKPKKQSSQIEFDTPQGNNIKVVTQDTSTVDWEQLEDRYTFQFDYADGKDNVKRKIDLFSDKPLIYRGDISGYPGHFIILGDDGIGGNWIDFAGEGITWGDIKIKEKSPYHYELEFKKLKKKQKFKSIGGLNLMDLTFTYYMGEYTVTSPDSLERIETYLEFNITYDNSTQSDISATLNYPANISSSQTKTVGDGFIYFREDFDAYEETRGVANFTEFNWSLTVLQQDSDTTTFDQVANHTNYGWDMDDCSTYNTSLFNYTVLDEKTGLPIKFNSSFVHEFWVDGYSSLTRNYDIIKTDSAYNYTFCKFPDYINVSGNTNHIVSSNGYESKDYRLFDVAFEGVKTIYLLATEISNAYITYIITDGSLTKIEDAVMKFYRNINNIQTLVYEASTDFAGSVTVYQDQQNTYDITINASGYPFKSFFLRPISTLYTIQLDEADTPYFDDPYDGIRYKVEPSIWIFNQTGEQQTITFTLEGSDLEYSGITFSKYNPNEFFCNPSSCENISYSSTGGAMSITFNTNVSQNWDISLYFKKTGQEVTYINENPSVITPVTETITRLYAVFKDLAENTSQKVRIIIVAVAAFALVAFLSSLGIVGIFAVPGVLSVLWFFSIVGCRWNQNPLLGQCDFYFIHPTVTALISIILIGIYVIMYQRTN